MKIGDIVCCKANGSTIMGGETAVIVSEIRHGINSSFVDILVKGNVQSANICSLEIISEEQWLECQKSET